MKPLDSRLLVHAASARPFFVVGGVVALAHVAITVAFAWLLSHAIVDAIDGARAAAIAPQLGAILLVVIARFVVGYVGDWSASRAATGVKSELRMKLIAAVARLGPRWLATRNSSRLAVVSGPGLDALDAYFGKYLPQLLLTAIATPILVVVIAMNDLISGIVVAATLPLIPLFMALIGWASRAAQQRQWLQLGVLSAAFLDVVDGLTTLTVFGRQHRQGARIRALTDSYRARTMVVLRVSFLSGFVLEFGASLAVALVAVSIGLRLLDGAMPFGVGLFVLLLAPEAFLPIRNVGVQFHAAAEGVEAAKDVLDMLDDDDRSRGAQVPRTVLPFAPGADRGLTFRGVRVDRDTMRLRGITATAQPGRLTVLAGASGSGKSSLFDAMLGFAPYEGDILLGGDHVGPGELRPLIAWSPQRTDLLAGTIGDNVALGSARPDRAVVARAMTLASCDELDPFARVTRDGSELSGGERQRVAIARAFYRALERDCRILILDEPTSALDRGSELGVLAGLHHFIGQGFIVIVASHRPAVLDAADDIVAVADASAADVETVAAS